MIALASDHVGIELKRVIMKYLDERKIEYKDYGTYSQERCDYPVYALRRPMQSPMEPVKKVLFFAAPALAYRLLQIRFGAFAA